MLRSPKGVRQPFGAREPPNVGFFCSLVTPLASRTHSVSLCSHTPPCIRASRWWAHKEKRRARVDKAHGYLEANQQPPSGYRDLGCFFFFSLRFFLFIQTLVGGALTPRLPKLANKGTLSWRGRNATWGIHDAAGIFCGDAFFLFFFYEHSSKGLPCPLLQARNGSK